MTRLETFLAQLHREYPSNEFGYEKFRSNIISLAIITVNGKRTNFRYDIDSITKYIHVI